MALTEKCCSRCGCISWDSDFGSYNEICRKDGKPCDHNGTVAVDGEIQ